MGLDITGFTRSSGRKGIGHGECPDRGRWQVFDWRGLASAQTHKTRCWFTSDLTAGSGGNGLRMERYIADAAPLSLDLWSDGAPKWGTSALDATTNDLVLAYSYTTNTDNIRIREDTAQIAIGRTVGQPASNGAQVTISGGDTNVNGIDVLSLSVWNDSHYGLRIKRAETVPNTKRVRMVLFAETVNGFQVGTDSLNTGVECDFWVQNNATGLFPLVIGSDNTVYLGTAGAGDDVRVVGRFGGQASLTNPFRLKRVTTSLIADTNYTALAADMGGIIWRFTSTLTITATRDIVMPLVSGMFFFVRNDVTGASGSLRFIGASGTGITVANARGCFIYCDGTNWVRMGADTVLV